MGSPKARDIIAQGGARLCERNPGYEVKNETLPEGERFQFWILGFGFWVFGTPGVARVPRAIRANTPHPTNCSENQGVRASRPRPISLRLHRPKSDKAQPLSARIQALSDVTKLLIPIPQLDLFGLQIILTSFLAFVIDE
jgi:hypothetical protein